jgi:hypothetical protein
MKIEIDILDTLEQMEMKCILFNIVYIPSIYWFIIAIMPFDISADVSWAKVVFYIYLFNLPLNIFLYHWYNDNNVQHTIFLKKFTFYFTIIQLYLIHLMTDMVNFLNDYYREMRITYAIIRTHTQMRKLSTFRLDLNIFKEELAKRFDDVNTINQIIMENSRYFDNIKEEANVPIIDEKNEEDQIKVNKIN